MTDLLISDLSPIPPGAKGRVIYRWVELDPCPEGPPIAVPDLTPAQVEEHARFLAEHARLLAEHKVAAKPYWKTKNALWRLEKRNWMGAKP